MSDSFAQVFRDKLDAIEGRAKACGLTLTDLCRESGIARATPDRWRKRPPKSIQLVDKLEDVVIRAEKNRAAGK